jgi:ABC-type glutathione transport system ATPase component
MLSVNNIEVLYDRVILVLKGVSLTVPRGGIVALPGANGAGKTTTLKAISNLLGAERGEVAKGTIVLDGAEVQALSPSELGGAALLRPPRRTGSASSARSPGRPAGPTKSPPRRCRGPWCGFASQRPLLLGEQVDIDHRTNAGPRRTLRLMQGVPTLLRFKFLH